MEVFESCRDVELRGQGRWARRGGLGLDLGMLEVFSNLIGSTIGVQPKSCFSSRSGEDWGYSLRNAVTFKAFKMLWAAEHTTPPVAPQALPPRGPTTTLTRT